MTFEGIVGSSHTGDLAIDDVSVRSGSCQGHTATPTSIFSPSVTSDQSTFNPPSSQALSSSGPSTFSPPSSQASLSSPPLTSSPLSSQASSSSGSPTSSPPFIQTSSSTEQFTSSPPSSSSEQSSSSQSTKGPSSSSSLPSSALPGIVYMPSFLFRGKHLALIDDRTRLR